MNVTKTNAAITEKVKNTISGSSKSAVGVAPVILSRHNMKNIANAEILPITA